MRPTRLFFPADFPDLAADLRSLPDEVAEMEDQRIKGSVVPEWRRVWILMPWWERLRRRL